MIASRAIAITAGDCRGSDDIVTMKPARQSPRAITAAAAQGAATVSARAVLRASAWEWEGVSLIGNVGRRGVTRVAARPSPPLFPARS